ncbi:MAG: PAS domain S-box protein [Chitinophagaceae bacterium]
MHDKFLTDEQGVIKGRTTYITALLLALFGIIFLLKLRGNGNPKTTQSLLLIISIVSLFNIISVIYGVKNIYFGPYAMYKMRLGGSISCLLLSLILFAEDSKRGVMAVILGPEPGGKIIRAFIPIVLLFPILLGLIDRFAETSGLYQDALGLALSSVAIMIMFFIILVRTAKSNNKIYKQLLAEMGERKKAGKQARDSELFANTIYENIPHMVFVKDGEELRFRSINKAGEELIGHTNEEIFGKNDHDFFPQKEADLFRERDKAVFDSNVPVVIEEPITTSRHGVRWLRTKKIGVRDENGKPLYMLGISEDITELKEKQERLNKYNAELEKEIEKRTKELRKSEERYQKMVEDVKDYSILMLDTNGIILNWNKGAERVKGYKAEEIMGKSFKKFYTNDDQLNEVPEKILNEAKRIGRAASEGWRVKKDGSAFWASVSITALRNEHSEITGFSKVTRDITEKKLAEQQVIESEKQFQAFMGTLPAMAWIVDERGYFKYTNPLYNKTFNYNNLSGKNVADLFPVDIVTEYQKNNDIVFQSNIPLETIEPSLRPDGTRGTLKIFKFPLGTSKGVKLLGGIAVDITQMIETEEALKQANDQLLTSNRELEQFAYVASHDLQEPLRMVSSFLQLLEKKYKGHMDEKADQYIHFAVDGAERMKTLITDLLRFSRLGTTKEADSVVDCNNIVKDIIQVYQQTIDETKAVINSCPLPVLKAQKTQIEQLFQNLISNALKYRGEAAPVITICCKDKINKWHFSISDNGIGIDKKYYDKIFIIFQRLHGKNDYSGTGIGLAICKKIVEQHGGEIWVQSEPGEGSVFNFTFPKNN